VPPRLGCGTCTDRRPLGDFGAVCSGSQPLSSRNLARLCPRVCQCLTSRLAPASRTPAQHAPARAPADTGDAALHCGAPGLDVLYAALKAAGADIAARNGAGATPLHAAVASGDANLMRMLLLDACDADAVRADGATPLHLAVQHGDDAARPLPAACRVSSVAKL
jgi:ankyrin repeat protein